MGSVAFEPPAGGVPHLREDGARARNRSRADGVVLDLLAFERRSEKLVDLNRSEASAALDAKSKDDGVAEVERQEDCQPRQGNQFKITQQGEPLFVQGVRGISLWPHAAFAIPGSAGKMEQYHLFDAIWQSQENYD